MNQIYQGTSHLNCHNTNEKNVLWGQWIQNSKLELSQTIWASDFSTYSYLRRLDFPPRGLCLVNFFSNYNGNNSHCRDPGNNRKKKEREKINLIHILTTHHKHCWDSDDFICVRMCGERQTETEKLIKICFLSVLWIFFFFMYWMEIPWFQGAVKLVPDGEAGLWSVSADSMKREERSMLFVTKWIFKPSEVLLSKQHFQHPWYIRMSGEGSLFLCGLCSCISLSSLISLFVYLFTPETCKI